MPVRPIGSIIVAVLATLAPIAAQAASDETGNLRVTVLTEERQPLSNANIVVEARDGRTWQTSPQHSCPFRRIPYRPRT